MLERGQCVFSEKIEEEIIIIMAQPVRNKSVSERNKPKKKISAKRKHPKYGTSKLEEKFAKEFLDKLGVKYERQFEAKEIKRFYDFYLPDYNVLIEIDGDYYHGKGLQFEEKSPMQKHNAMVDRIKDNWALWHHIPLFRIWEGDINKNSSGVMKMLKSVLEKYGYIAEQKENKKKRHINKDNNGTE